MKMFSFISKRFYFEERRKKIRKYVESVKNSNFITAFKDMGYLLNLESQISQLRETINYEYREVLKKYLKDNKAVTI